MNWQRPRISLQIYSTWITLRSCTLHGFMEPKGAHLFYPDLCQHKAPAMDMKNVDVAGPLYLDLVMSHSPLTENVNTCDLAPVAPIQRGKIHRHSRPHWSPLFITVKHFGNLYILLKRHWLSILQTSFALCLASISKILTHAMPEVQKRHRGVLQSPISTNYSPRTGSSLRLSSADLLSGLMEQYNFDPFELVYKLDMY